MNWTNKQTTKIFQAILKLKTQTEAEKFFRDLLTLQEIQEMSRRWQAVLLLDQGLPYRKIAEITGHSTTTVARIAHWLKNGQGGYRMMLERIKKTIKK